MLFSYQQRTQQLLYDLKQEIINPAFLTSFINTARGQIAGEGMCVRRIGTVPTTVGQRCYFFSGLTISDTSVAGALSINWIMYNVGTGQKWVKNKAWPWYSYYRLNNPVPVSGPPTEWAQYQEGSAGATSGSFYLDPLPDLIYTLQCDCYCYPIPLVNDSTAESLPYLWTDAVPYFAAYLAYLTAQKKDQAMAMMDLYSQFMQRARNAATPGINRFLYPQSGDPFMANRLGVQTRGGAGG